MKRGKVEMVTLGQLASTLSRILGPIDLYLVGLCNVVRYDLFLSLLFGGHLRAPMVEAHVLWC